MRFVAILLVLAISLTACQSDNSTVTKTDNHKTEATTPAPAAKPQLLSNPKYVISTDGILGLKAGEVILDHASLLKGAKAQQDGGMPTVYRIIDEGHGIGFLYPTKENLNLIGEITITHPEAATAEGISTGFKMSTFKRMFPGTTSLPVKDKKGSSQITKDGLRYEFKCKDDLKGLDQALIDEISYLRSITILP